MSGTIPQSAPTNTDSRCHEETTLEWTVHLAGRSPGKLAGVAAAAFLVALVGFRMFDSPIPVLAVVFMLIFSVSDFLFPVSYSVSREGASSASLLNRTQIEWSSVRRMCAGDDGIKLSPFARPSRLDAFRGVYLRFDENREEVMGAVKRLWKSHDD